MPTEIEGTAYRRHGFLLGFLNKAEVDAVFSMNPVRVEDGRDPITAFQEARVARAALGPHIEGALDSMPATLEAAITEVKRRAIFQEEYEAKGDFEFGSVPIGSLLTPQFEADLEYVSELATRLSAAPDDQSDFAFCFPQGELAEPIIKGNTVVFTAKSPNIAINPVPTIRRTSEGFDVVVEAKDRPNYVMVARIGQRLVLQNVHKILALRARGRSRVFALVHDVSRIEELGLPLAGLSMFQPPNYTQAQRPPLVTDFEGQAMVPVLNRGTYTVYRIVIGVEPPIVIPALKEQSPDIGKSERLEAKLLTDAPKD